MAKEGFFQKIKNFLFGESEEAITEFSQPEEADVSIQEPQESEVPRFEFNPSGVGPVEPTAEFTDRSIDVGRETPDIVESYRVEHEPYRYEPDGDRNICITEAYLHEVHPKNTESIFHKLSPLKIKADRNCVIYSEFHTDNQGFVIEPPEVDNPNHDPLDPDSKATMLDPDGTYRLLKDATLPDTEHFELPSGNVATGGETSGKEGKYRFPICFIKDGKLERNGWTTTEDARSARLYGGLEGIRGPLIWRCGYNKLINVGGGKQVYKEYVRSEQIQVLGNAVDIGLDEKRLRTINERTTELGQSDANGDPVENTRKDADGQALANPPFTGEAQVKVKYNSNHNEILITGNDYNKHWKIGGQGVAVVEDGLVTCLSDLTCKDLSNLTLNTTAVLSSASGTTTVITSGSTTTVLANINETDNVATVLTSAGSVTVALEPTNTDFVSVVAASAVTTVAAPVTTGNMVDVAEPPNSSTDFASNVWSGGSSSAGGGLTPIKVSGCGTTDSSGNYTPSSDCVWVLGIAATGANENTAPTFPALITGATQSTSVLKSLGTTSVVETTTDRSVIKSSGSPVSVLKSVPTASVATAGNTVNVIKSNVTPVDVITTSTTATVLTTGTTVTVYAPTGTASNVTVLREAPDGTSENSLIKVVECPTTQSCPVPAEE